MPIRPNIRRCNATKFNGKQCGSPALTGAPYCHFHADASQRRRAMKVPNLESTTDVQQAITETIRALIEGRIDRQRANSIFFGLRLAQKSFGFNRVIRLKRNEEEGAAADHSVVQRLLDEVQSVQESEQQMEAEEAAQQAAEDREAIAEMERTPVPPQRPRPHHFTDDIPRDEQGYLKPTRKQEAEIERLVMAGNHPNKKTG